MLNYFFDILTRIWWNSCIGKAYMNAIFLFCQCKCILLKKFNLVILLLLIPTYLLRNFTNFSKKHKILHVCWLCKKLITDLSCFLSKNFRKPCAGKRITSIWTTPPDVSDEDSIAAVRISHIWLFWNRDLVQRYAFPDSSDIFRCFARQEHDCSSAVHPLPHCILLLTHIQKVVTKEQGLQLQIYIVIGLLWLLIDKFLTTANAYTSSQLL